jgi:hypothetical protein
LSHCLKACLWDSETARGVATKPAAFNRLLRSYTVY